MAPVLLFLACGKKEASQEEVKSDLIQSISLCSEADTFVRYISQGHSTYSFASGHLRYLLEEVNRNTQELSHLNAAPDLQKILDLDRVQLNLLSTQIETVSRHLGESEVPVDSERQIAKIRMTLVQANSHL
jgi:hypothetical protein